MTEANRRRLLCDSTTSEFSDVTWPAFCFAGPHRMMMRCDSEMCLSRLCIGDANQQCTLAYLFLVDVNGIKYELGDPIFDPRLSALQWMTSRIFGKRYPVRWKVTCRGNVNIDEIKKLILEEYHEFEDIWLDGVDPDAVEADLKNVAAATSIIDVFHALGWSDVGQA